MKMGATNISAFSDTAKERKRERERGRERNSFHGWLSMAVSGNEKVSIKSRRLAKSRLSILNIHARWNRSSDSPPRVPPPHPALSLCLVFASFFLRLGRRRSAFSRPRNALPRARIPSLLDTRYSPPHSPRALVFTGIAGEMGYAFRHSRAIIERDARR